MKGREERTLVMAKQRRFNGAGFLAAARVYAASLGELGAVLGSDRVRRQARNAGAQGAELGRLNGHGLAHDRAAVGKQLQLGHGAAAGRGRNLRANGAGRSRQSSQRGRRRLLEERTHGLGLPQNSVHGGDWGRNAIGAQYGKLG